MGSVTIENLTKEYDDVMAVEDLSIEVEEGEFLVIVGPSGCGKSTTLNCLAGLEKPSSGRIFIDGDDVTDEKPQNRDIAMVFQNFSLYPHMDVKSNLGFGLKMRTSMQSSERKDRIEDVAALLSLTDHMDKRPKELSGGQQQRVALGRAIAREPAVFLMDEPLSNLDAKLRTKMRTEIQSFHDQIGVTTIYVTHDQTEAMTMGDRIAILNRGQLQQIGTPLECYHAPNNQFVAGFVGSPSMNFIGAEIKEGVLRTNRFELNLRSGSETPPSQGRREVTLGLRPEHLQITDTKNALFDVEAAVVEPLGNVSNLYFELDSVEYTATIDGGRRIQAGERIGFEFSPHNVHIFDSTTGEAIRTRGVRDSDKHAADIDT